MELRTERLTLRPIAADDLAIVHEYRSDAETVEYMLHEPLTLEKTRRLLDEAAGLWSAERQERFNLTFAVVLDGTVIGEVSAWNIGKEFQPASADPAEVWIGYVFHPRHHGHGYATESVHALVDWLFERGATRIFANLFADNTASLRLLRRLGFEDHVFYPAEKDDTGRNLASYQLRLDRPSA